MKKLSDLSCAKIAAEMGMIKKAQMALDEQGNVVYYDPETMTLDEDGVVHPKSETGVEPPEAPPEPPRTPTYEQEPEVQDVEPETGQGLPTMIPVDSSNVSKFGYDDAKQVLYVGFHDKGGGEDRLYAYYDVEPDVYTAFMESDSKGQFVWKYLRNRYDYDRI